MLVLMTLSKKRDDNTIEYLYGSDRDKLDGMFVINPVDISLSTIDKLPSDDSVTRGYAIKALCKLTRKISEGDIPQELIFAS